jgi:quercetin dioxygenase-like cupin family protein
MATTHAGPAETVSVRPLGNKLSTAQTTTLVKTELIEVIRLVLPAGKKLARHKVPGEIRLQCLEGTVRLRTTNRENALSAGDLIYLEGAQEHSLQAEVGSSLLLTIVLTHKRG